MTVRAPMLHNCGFAGGFDLTVAYGAANAVSGDPDGAINLGHREPGRLGRNQPLVRSDDNSECRPVLSGPVPGGMMTLPFDVFSKRLACGGRSPP